MAKAKKETQKALIDHLSDLGYGQAEAEKRELSIRRFYPVKQHLRAFDPDVTLVVGERGTGKSALFKAVFENNLLVALAHFAPDQRLPFKETDRIQLVPGYPIGAQFPDPRGLRNIAGTPERVVDLWFAYLLRILKDKIESKEELGFLNFPGGAPDKILRSFDDSGNNEWPWLQGVKTRIAENRLAPWKRRELQDMLNEDWGASWGQAGKSIVPPAQNARELIDYLVELGVFRERANDRIDVPDIYLFGLELRRKGGVKRK